MMNSIPIISFAPLILNLYFLLGMIGKNHGQTNLLPCLSSTLLWRAPLVYGRPLGSLRSIFRPFFPFFNFLLFSDKKFLKIFFKGKIWRAREKL